MSASHQSLCMSCWLKSHYIYFDDGFFSVLREIQSDVKFITLYNYVRVVLCHPALPFYRLMQIYQNGISQQKKLIIGKYSNTTKSREKKPTKIKDQRRKHNLWKGYIDSIWRSIRIFCLIINVIIFTKQTSRNLNYFILNSTALYCGVLHWCFLDSLHKTRYEY